MIRLLALLLLGAAAPAPGQHQGHGQHDHAQPKAPAKPPAKPEQPADPHAGHRPPEKPAADPHAGHVVPEEAADPHAGHGASEATPPAGPPPADALSGPVHAADLFWSPADMEASRKGMREEHGGMDAYRFLVDRLEARVREGRDGYAWDAQAWWGGDIDKLWLKSEGEGGFAGAVEAAEVQALWSRAIDPWFDLQLGVRYDIRPRPGRAYLVAGVQGLAPYWFELDAALFLSEKGDLSARIEGEYDFRITRKLILQPRAELELALQDVPELGIGSGLSTGELGARLRYEIRPELAPYVGVEYERAFGDGARFRRAAGEGAGGWSFLLGLRAWF
jgi:copper resistance protein B